MLLIKKDRKIDGLKLVWGTPMTPNFNLTHSWELVPEKPPKNSANPMMQAAMDMEKKKNGYTMSAQYAHIDESNPREPSFVMFSKMASSGSLQSVFMVN